MNFTVQLINSGMLLNAWRWFYMRSAQGPLRWALIISMVLFTGGQIGMLCDDRHFNAQVFQGQLTYTIKCPEGHIINEETNPFWTLPLSLKDTDDSTYSVVSRGISEICRLMFQYSALLWIDETWRKTTWSLENRTLVKLKARSVIIILYYKCVYQLFCSPSDQVQFFVMFLEHIEDDLFCILFVWCCFLFSISDWVLFIQRL